MPHLVTVESTISIQHLRPLFLALIHLISSNENHIEKTQVFVDTFRNVGTY